MTNVPNANIEWLEGGIAQFERTVKLYRAGRIPPKILSWMFVVDCKRVLRAVYGDDLSVAAALRDAAIEDVKTQQELEMGSKF